MLPAQWFDVDELHVPIEQLRVTAVPAVHDCIHIPVGYVHMDVAFPSHVPPH
jgi:hypothetical protein